jgi:exopolysaccharide biosynthesis polyprenyl glycosylphosphotransferase
VLAVFSQQNRNDIIKKISLIKERFTLAKGITIDRGIDEIKAEIDKYDTVLICDFDPDLKDEVLKYCYAENKRIYLLPSSGDTILNGSYQVQVFDTPVLFLHNGGLSMEQRIIKRTFDIIVSGVGLIVASPFMLAIAIGIKLTSKGPVIFKQQRITRGNKVFNIYKFRSMKVADDNEVKKTTVGDDRITSIGKIIRPLRLDELPQLFNILFGDMSVVGPRPEMVELVEDYSKQLPEFNLRHKVKAGLTGYAQIYGKYNTTPQNKLNMDIHYIEHYSFLEDIKLCAMTLKILFVRESTEGFSEKESKLKNTEEKE